ncbi:MAG: nucleotidyltransferase domain-containing protein [bacterium]|nr:nucleotidyltransferase domain-containing protein [bacterium]
MGAQSDIELVREVIERYLARVRRELSVEAVYLFGSHARGTATPDSDIDLAIVSSSLQGHRFHDNVRLGTMTWGIDTRIEAWGFRPEVFNEDHLMPAEILHTGIRIYPPAT